MPTPLAIIGLGVIGGSLARALRSDPAWRTIGWTASEQDRAAARREGIATARSLADAAAAARARGIILLAVPLDRVAELAHEVLRIAPSALVLHTAGLQGARAVRLESGDRDRTFGTHPLAGTHGTGFASSSADLFANAAVSVEQRLPDEERERVLELWRAAGATRIDLRDADTHDALVAWASHLPQLTATALASVLDASGTPFSACGPGARDSTRLAQSALEMWRPILERAPAETLASVRALREALLDLEQAIVDRDASRLERRWHAARRWRSAAEPDVP